MPQFVVYLRVRGLMDSKRDNFRVWGLHVNRSCQESDANCSVARLRGRDAAENEATGQFGEFRRSRLNNRDLQICSLFVFSHTDSAVYIEEIATFLV